MRTPARIRGIVEEFASIGMTGLTFTPTVAGIEEADRLADLVL